MNSFNFKINFLLSVIFGVPWSPPNVPNDENVSEDLKLLWILHVILLSENFCHCINFITTPRSKKTFFLFRYLCFILLNTCRFLSSFLNQTKEYLNL